MRSILAAAILAASLSPATAATPCDDIWQKPLADGQVLLKKAAPQIKGLPSKPKVFEVMQSGGWTLVWARFADAEPGGYFLDGNRYVDVWGGVAAGESEKDIAGWATKLDKKMPVPLARCFGWYVVTGREQGPPTRPNPFNGH
ncbi:MAG: hypothetical protein WCJ15_09665 [Alphaproteobacteria bacterium]|jgi:hypothetical protein